MSERHSAVLSHLLFVELRAIGRAKVNKNDLSVLAFDRAVLAGALDIHDDDVGADSATEDISWFRADWESLSLIGSFNDF